MSRYDLNISRLLSLLPHALRKTDLVLTVNALLVPVTELHMNFSLFRQKKEYRLQHSGQVFSLEQVICDFTGNGGCYITDGELDSELLVPYDGNSSLANYQIAMPHDGSVTPQLSIKYEGLGFSSYADFIIHLPMELYGTVDEAALCATVDEYKLAGKFYRIVYDDVVIPAYSFLWSTEVCAEEDVPIYTYNFAWSDEICKQVQHYDYDFKWTVEICTQINEPYSIAWTDEICVKILEKYSAAWSGETCVQEVKKEYYQFAWSSDQCIKENIINDSNN